jgi:hypothetical protein
MKISLNDVVSSMRTKIEESSLIEGIFIARSAVNIRVKCNDLPVFGFGADFDRKKCHISSMYELVEHLVFMPQVYTDVSLNLPVQCLANQKNLHYNNPTIRQFLNGFIGPQGQFYGNGCSISDEIGKAINHSKNELLERHLCCEIWYKRSRPLFKVVDYSMSVLNPSVKLEFFITNISNIYFGMASLECCETGFFALGAAIRDCQADAFEHAACEVIMLYEDMKKRRSGLHCIGQSQSKILTLRDKNISLNRKNYFLNLINAPSSQNEACIPHFETIYFEPFPKLYAARSFSDNALDPRIFEAGSETNILPLF